MAQPTKKNRIFAGLTALMLVLMLVGSVMLASHHHHDDHHDHHDEATCTVCQLIEATITTLRNTQYTPVATWNASILVTSLILIVIPFFAMMIPDTLVQQKMRCDN